MLTYITVVIHIICFDCHICSCLNCIIVWFPVLAIFLLYTCSWPKAECRIANKLWDFETIINMFVYLYIFAWNEWQLGLTICDVACKKNMLNNMYCWLWTWYLLYKYLFRESLRKLIMATWMRFVSFPEPHLQSQTLFFSKGYR
jgi:hypothetical protein